MSMTEEYVTKQWAKIINEIKPFIENLNLFDIHVKNLKIDFFDENNLFVFVDSDFVRTTLIENYLDKFNEISSEIFGKNINVSFVDKEKLLSVQTKNKNYLEKENNYIKKEPIFRKNMTFSNFVVDDSNKIAYDAAKILSSNQNKKWNPLFIYGNTGLGKTHLANALCNEYFKNFPNSKIIYISSDDFTREVFKCLTNGTIESFKNYYQDVDLLVIEDIQFLTNRDKTNEIFFNIFNDLMNKEKIILITSDKNPDQLYDFDPRMISRFSCGLTISVKKPNTKTVVEILNLKLKEMDFSFKLTEASIRKIVNLFNTDIRKLEGILNRIAFFAMTKYTNLTILDSEQIDEILESEYEIINKELNKDPNILLEKICRNYNIKKDNVLSSSRKSEHTNVRKICMYIFKKNLHMSLTEIGKFFNRDHSTVKTSIESVEKMINEDSSLKLFLNEILVKY
ncbi:chromosomal replication initiator protein DnaA [Mycoplasmoides pirum]|uniref:chromosomal replication initiator protein DnaA n=1 Tax=Mycoplasmoides pirum TaxID=2122 RepID=UPI000696D65A|nr:chromosomal replication initiator protein DnaA [Mycoplasmoides pirum]